MNPLEQRIAELERKIQMLERFITFDTNTVTVHSSLAVKGLINMQGSIITTGMGSPEGIITATVGSLYLRRNGVPGQTLYVKENDVTNIGWSTTA